MLRLMLCLSILSFRALMFHISICLAMAKEEAEQA